MVFDCKLAEDVFTTEDIEELLEEEQLVEEQPLLDENNEVYEFQPQQSSQEEAEELFSKTEEMSIIEPTSEYSEVTEDIVDFPEIPEEMVMIKTSSPCSVYPSTRFCASSSDGSDVFGNSFKLISRS